MKGDLLYKNRFLTGTSLSIIKTSTAQVQLLRKEFLAGRISREQLQQLRRGEIPAKLLSTAQAQAQLGGRRGQEQLPRPQPEPLGSRLGSLVQLGAELLGGQLNRDPMQASAQEQLNQHVLMNLLGQRRAENGREEPTRGQQGQKGGFQGLQGGLLGPQGGLGGQQGDPQRPFPRRRFRGGPIASQYRQV